MFSLLNSNLKRRKMAQNATSNKWKWTMPIVVFSAIYQKRQEAWKSLIIGIENFFVVTRSQQGGAHPTREAAQPGVDGFYISTYPPRANKKQFYED